MATWPGIFVAVIAGHHQRRRPVPCVDHRDGHEQVGPAAEIVRIRDAEMPLLRPGLVEIDGGMNLAWQSCGRLRQMFSEVKH